MKISANMIKTLERLRQVDGQTTSFGYVRYQAFFLNANTVGALITRGLLEQNGSMAWSDGHPVSLYQVSAKGKETLATAVTNQ